MIFNIILALIFIGGLGALWYRTSLKIPELVAIPDAVITERLHEDSARFHLFLLHIKQWYREGKFREAFFDFLAKTAYKLHIVVLRFDNILIEFLKKLRASGVSPAENAMSSAEYWSELRSEESSIPVVPEADGMAQKSAHGNRIQEVRKKKV